MIADGSKQEKGEPNRISSTFLKTQAANLCSFTLLSILPSTCLLLRLAMKVKDTKHGVNSCETDLFNDSTSPNETLLGI